MRIFQGYQSAPCSSGVGRNHRDPRNEPSLSFIQGGSGAPSTRHRPRPPGVCGLKHLDAQGNAFASAFYFTVWRNKKLPKAAQSPRPGKPQMA